MARIIKCKCCDKPFISNNLNQLFCSGACKTQNYRNNNINTPKISKSNSMKNIFLAIIKLKQFVTESNGQYSMARLALVLANMVLIFSVIVWGIICLRTNQVQDYPWNLTVIIIGANGWKVAQRIFSEKTEATL